MAKLNELELKIEVDSKEIRDLVIEIREKSEGLKKSARKVMIINAFAMAANFVTVTIIMYGALS